MQTNVKSFGLIACIALILIVSGCGSNRYAGLTQEQAVRLARLELRQLAADHGLTRPPPGGLTIIDVAKTKNDLGEQVWAVDLGISTTERCVRIKLLARPKPNGDTRLIYGFGPCS